MDRPVTINLSHDEALVLFEALATGVAEGAEIGRGAQVAVDSIEAQLERILVEPFQPDYRRLVQEAERRLTDET